MGRKMDGLNPNIPRSAQVKNTSEIGDTLRRTVKHEIHTYNS